MKKLEYYVLDVFTEQRYSGNQLSVIVCNDILGQTQYADIAREFGFSETSFIQIKEGGAVSVRSFTPTGVEVGGAGHNLLGAVSLALLKSWSTFRDETGSYSVTIGGEKIGLEIAEEKNNYTITMKQQPAEVIAHIPAAVIAPAINLSAEDLIHNDWQCTIVKTEVAHLMVPVADHQTLHKAKPERALLTALSRQYGFEGYYLFTTTHPYPDHIAETRFFNPLIGIDEDAATGTAAGPLAGYLEQQNYISRDKAYRIMQGAAMRHASGIHVNVKDNGVWVGGASVIVMEGVLSL